MRPFQKKRINIVLDLDNTLISAIDTTEEHNMGKETLRNRQRVFKWFNMDDEFKVFERPYLQQFLTWLFENFTVSIWTAASKLYALSIIEKVVLADKGRELDYILFSHHCRESTRNCNCQKKLSMLSEEFPIGYDINNTYIIDDNLDVFNGQPDMCIQIKRFDIQDPKCENDTELLIVQQKLERIRIQSLYA